MSLNLLKYHPDLKRFSSKTRISSSDKCWMWNGSTKCYGRIGQFWMNGSMISAHRASYIIYVGLIPKGLCVCHHCDTPLCVNPNHLFLGTQVENMADMNRKGRQVTPVGERNGNSVLKTREVIKIKTHLANGIKRHVLAKRFNVNWCVIDRILNGLTWKHLTAAEKMKANHEP